MNLANNKHWSWRPQVSRLLVHVFFLSVLRPQAPAPGRQGLFLINVCMLRTWHAAGYMKWFVLPCMKWKHEANCIRPWHSWVFLKDFNAPISTPNRSQPLSLVLILVLHQHGPSLLLCARGYKRNKMFASPGWPVRVPCAVGGSHSCGL